MLVLALRKAPELQAVADAWRWPPSLTLSEWADRYRVLPAADAEPGPFRTARFPLIQEPQDVLGSGEYRTVVLWASTQSAKTTIGVNWIGKAIHYDPGRTLVIYPTEDKATEFSTEKLEPMIFACPALSAKAAIGTARTHRKSVLSKTFPSMLLLIRGGNSENPFSSGSFRYVWLDELDRIPPNKEGRPLDLARQRVTTYWNHVLLISSTCTDEGSSEIASEYEKSDQRKPYVPCLACGHLHILEWEHIRYAGQTPQEAEATARYVCPACGHEHVETDKPAMLKRLEWRKGNPTSRVAGFWWSALYSPWVSWGQLASEWVAAQEDDDALKVFTTCRLARLWKPRREAPPETALAACIDSGRPAGTVPEETILLTGGADVMKRWIYGGVRAWGPEGRSWLVLRFKLDREQGSLAMLDEFFAVDYGGFPVRMVLVDSGWDEEVVYDYCLTRRNCAPSKGTPSDRDFLVKESEQTREKGQYRGRRFSLWHVNTNRLREHIHDRILVPDGDPRCWRIHADPEPEYLKAITSWARQEKKIKGRLVNEWVQLGQDHDLDWEIYAYAASRLPHVAPLLVARKAARPPATIQKPKHDAWAVRPLRVKL